MSLLHSHLCGSQSLAPRATYHACTSRSITYRSAAICAASPPARPACRRVGGSLHTLGHRAQDVRARGGRSEDPYTVLGISQSADSEAVSRAYKVKLREAGKDEGQKQRVESAHSSIMMAALTSRLKGGGQEISKEIKYADKAQYFPWRPKRYPAGRNFTLIVGVIQALLLAWSLLSPLTAGSQPLVTSAAAGAGANLLKQNQIFPPPPSSSEDPEKKGRGMKNVIRGLILAIAATFIGCAITVTIPDTLAGAFNRSMPYWFYESQNQLLTVGTTISNFIMTGFFR